MKVSRHTIITLAIVLLLLPVGLVQAAGYNLAGVGAKALAMSGAFRGISDDWSAMYWNPAGLAGQESIVYLEVKSLYPVVWVTPKVPGQLSGYEFYRNSREISTRQAGFPAGAFAMTYRHSEKMTFGFSLFAPTAIGADWEKLTVAPPAGYNNTVPWPDKDWQSDLKVIDIHPSVGYQATDKLKVGAGLSVVYALLSLQTPVLVPTGAPMPYQNFYAIGELEGSGIGFGFNVGALYDITEMLSVGVSYKGPVTVGVEGNMNQTVYLPYNPALSAANGNDPRFLGGTEEASPDAIADFPLPQEAGIGFALRPFKGLVLGFDAMWTNWGAVDVITVEADGDGPFGQPAQDTEMALHYEDVIRFNVGGEYTILPESGLKLRAGYYYDPTAIPDAGLRPTITDVNVKHSVSFGAAYNISSKLIVEGYWEHLFTNTRQSQAEYDADGVLENLPGYWKMQVDTFGLQFSYRF